MSFTRFFHWGPLTALAIIKCITVTTLYMNSMWWPPNHTLGGLINQVIFLLFSTVATYNFVMATLTGPGFLPLKWQPKDPKDVDQLQYCKICEGYKAPRSHHCRKCNRCIKKMDHHCPWINHCVGWANHANFTLFLAFSIIGSIHGAVNLSIAFYVGVNRFWYLSHGYLHLATVQFTLYSIIMCILAMGLAIGVVIALGMLLFFQLKTILKNQTGIEIWIVEKANYRRCKGFDEPDFIYPYDLGWKENLRQVFTNACVANGDGVEWPVADGCDQYTLTREQLEQKAEKRARTRTFKCIRPATGRFLPLCSQGIRVCIASPCTDEPRIRLKPEDIIKVTRFRRHWLFGERVVSESENSQRGKKKRTGPIRGWFPRRCAIEIDGIGDVYADEDDEPIIQHTKSTTPPSSLPSSSTSGTTKAHKRKVIPSNGVNNITAPYNTKHKNGHYRKNN